jgi:hypothetical protein
MVEIKSGSDSIESLPLVCISLSFTLSDEKFMHLFVIMKKTLNHKYLFQYRGHQSETL